MERARRRVPFCYVDDLVDGLVRMMGTGVDVTGPVNLGNPDEFSMRELADMVRALVGTSVSLVHHPLPADDPRQRRPDIVMARETLGWAPTVNLREGLMKTIAYFDALLGETKVA